MFALYSRFYALAARALKSTVPLAVSASIELDTKHYLGGWKSRMLVLHPGVGVDNEKMRKIKPSKEKPDAFFFSRLAPEKGIYDLPEIVMEMAKKKPDLKFSVAGRFGSAAFQNRYESLVTQRGVGGFLDYKGFLKEAELYSLVKAAKVLVYPSSHDAFPLVVLETLACGTPVVAYEIPAITLNFPAGLVKTVPVGNCKLMASEALKIIGDEDLRSELSKQALSFASQHVWEKVAEAERQAYDKVPHAQTA